MQNGAALGIDKLIRALRVTDELSLKTFAK